MKYAMERVRFVKLHGEKEILKTADLLEARDWFSLRHCVARIRALDENGRRSAMRLLRAAQHDRVRRGDKDERWFREYLDRKVDPLRFFVAPIEPAVYRDQVQPVVMDGKRIGVTLRGDRMSGNRVRVYYSSKFDYAIELVRMEIRQTSTGSEYLDSMGFKNHSTVFHVRRAENALPRAASR